MKKLILFNLEKKGSIWNQIFQFNCFLNFSKHYQCQPFLYNNGWEGFNFLSPRIGPNIEYYKHEENKGPDAKGRIADLYIYFLPLNNEEEIKIRSNETKIIFIFANFPFSSSYSQIFNLSLKNELKPNNKRENIGSKIECMIDYATNQYEKQDDFGKKAIMSLNLLFQPQHINYTLFKSDKNIDIKIIEQYCVHLTNNMPNSWNHFINMMSCSVYILSDPITIITIQNLRKSNLTKLMFLIPKNNNNIENFSSTQFQKFIFI